jgi:toxin ParE1/3/4
MPRVLRTSQANDDLDGIWSYIARDNISAADALLDKLMQRFELLARNPKIGELQPHLADGTYRRFTEGSYVIYFVPDEQGITIVRVLHGARDETRLL